MRPDRRPIVMALGLVALGACQAGPGMLQPRGEPAHHVAPLGWALVLTAIVVSLVTCTILGLGLRRALRRTTAPREDPARERRWFVTGVILTLAILGASYLFTMSVLRWVVTPDREASLTITVIGHQWWWEARYTDPDFATANEIHIPVGTTVHLALRSADVIHSFWVPALGGKTDLVPGAPTAMWLRADSAGRYQGRCAEYCGLQHAHMAFTIVAESPAAYRDWAAHQAADAAPVSDPALVAGRQLVVQHCGSCHAIRGTAASGSVGPDLTHVMSRATIAAGAARNTPGALGGWIADPDGLKPGTLMPRVPLPSTDFLRVLDYIRSLR